MSWQFFSSSVTGVSHHSTSTPCQDKHSVASSADGKWLAAVVSDGAGSAKYAEIGAETTVKIFCEALIALSSELNTRTPGTWINDFLIEKVLALRHQLRSIAGKDEINEFHCTLVAALIGEKGGFSIHIGDGHITGGSFELLNDGKINLNSNTIKSLPENGEYSNETFFVTEGNWIKHIRVSPLPPLDWIVLTSDGGSSLLFDGNDNVKQGFLIPILGFGLDDPQSANKLLASTISDPKANQLTSDDKTIVVAYRKNKILSPEKIIYKEITPVTTNQKLVTKIVTPANKVIKATTETTIDTKVSPNKFSKFKFFAKYLISILFFSSLIFVIFLINQPKEEKEIKNSPARSEESNKAKEFAEPNIPHNTQPASDGASANKEMIKDLPNESSQTKANTTDINLNKTIQKTVSGPLDKASSAK